MLSGALAEILIHAGMKQNQRLAFWSSKCEEVSHQRKYRESREYLFSKEGHTTWPEYHCVNEMPFTQTVGWPSGGRKTVAKTRRFGCPRKCNTPYHVQCDNDHTLAYLLINTTTKALHKTYKSANFLSFPLQHSQIHCHQIIFFQLFTNTLPRQPIFKVE